MILYHQEQPMKSGRFKRIAQCRCGGHFNVMVDDLGQPVPAMLASGGTFYGCDCGRMYRPEELVFVS